MYVCMYMKQTKIFILTIKYDQLRIMDAMYFVRGNNTTTYKNNFLKSV